MAGVTLSTGAIQEALVSTHFKKVDGRNVNGSCDFFELDTRAEWDAAAWRVAGLVGEGDVVELKAAIEPML